MSVRATAAALEAAQPLPAVDRYRPEIDGMRAVAVIAVILFHSGLLPNGYLGVDVFFVISGYLITGIIEGELIAKRFSLSNFYLRRIRRIIPLSLVTAAVALALGGVVMLPDDLENLAASVVATNLSANNVLQAVTTKNYWDVVNDFKPLLHTWSLGLEEQYYLAYPVLLLLAWKLSKKLLLPITVLLAAASLVLYLMPFSTHVVFYYLPFRFFELALGGAAAMHMRGEKIASTFQTPLLSALISVLVVSQPQLPAKLALIVTVLATAGLLICDGKGERYANGLLKNRLIVGVGVISYSIYMWHQVLLSFVRYTVSPELKGPTLIGIYAALVVMSVGSYFLVEVPFRNKKLVSTRAVLICCGLGFLVSTGVALRVYLQAGVLRDVPELGIQAGAVERGMHAKYNSRIFTYNREFSGDARVRVLVVGNSFGRDWANVLLESEGGEEIDLSYLPSGDDLDLLKRRAREADIVFWSMATRKELETLGLMSRNAWVVGTKNFGISNGVFYNSRSADYFGQRVKPEVETVQTNQELAREWGPKYINLLGKVMDDSGTVPVFTPSKHFISQDCRHLTVAGAKYFSELFRLELREIFGAAAAARQGPPRVAP